ncbi:hypothetical protein [Halocola ammonii]
MKAILLTVLFGIFCLAVSSQTEPTKPKAFDNTNSVQAELFGHGLFYSASFEKIILNGQRIKTSAQLGAAVYPSSIDIRGNFWAPVLLNEIISFGNHHAEIGGGFLLINEPVTSPTIRESDSKEWNPMATARIGYRYQKPDGRWIFRLAFTPIIEEWRTDMIHPSGGVAVGYAF